jgi:hypothetical protein
MATKIRDTTVELLNSVLGDERLSPAARLDFGISSIEHFQALAHVIRSGTVEAAQLDAVLGNGPAISKLVAESPDNPHQGLEFKTVWDDVFVRQPPQAQRERDERERDECER